MNSVTRTSNCSFPLRPLAAALLLIYATGIHSAPVFKNAPTGDVSVDTSVTNVTTVNQESNRAVANWREFSIGAGEKVEFVQPNANAVILNRVIGDNPSEIFGALQANGRVFLINPNGIVFGANSQVNVGGLVASTLRLKPGFQGNNELLEFELGSNSGEILNEGVINAKDIVFISPTIKNNGDLSSIATGGVVSLIAAGQVTVNTAGSDLVLDVQAGHEAAVIDQLGSLLAEGGKIVLIANSSTNGLPSVINTAGVNKAAQISIQGDTIQLTGQFNAGNPQGSLDVDSNNITQNAALAVSGASTLKAKAVTLGEAENDFGGNVSLNVSRATVLQDKNTLTVSGTGQSIKLKAPTVFVDGLQAESLTIDSNEVKQTRSLITSGLTTLKAEKLDLAHEDNDFQGQVKLAVSGQANLRDLNSLAVSGDLGDGFFEASLIEVNGLNATGNLTFKRGNVSQGRDQASALTVQGTTRIENSADVKLSNEFNDFSESVSLVNAGAVHLVDRNNISMEGRAGALAIDANTTGFGVVTLGSAQTSLQANTLAISANAVMQDGAIAVEKTSGFNAASVLLGNDENDFKGQVTLLGNTQATLHDSNTLNVAGSSKTLNLNANRIEINSTLNVSDTLNMKANNASQQAALTVTGTTTIQGKNTGGTGGSIRLENGGNDFGGVVKLENQVNASLADQNNLTVQGNAGDLNLKASILNTGIVTLGELTANSLSIDAKQVGQTATSAVVVTNATSLSAGTVSLDNSGNDFQGTVALKVDGQTELRDTNNLLVTGSIQGGTLTASNLVLENLKVTENLALNASVANGAITQNGILNVGGNATLQGSTAKLENSRNTFSGDVILNLSGAVTIHSSENLQMKGSATSVHASADKTLSVSTLNSQSIVLNAAQVQLNNFTAPGDLTLNGGNVTQQGALSVAGKTTLGASSVTLENKLNDFKGTVVLNGAGNVKLTDTNLIKLQGNANQLTVDSQAEVAQTGALAIAGTTNIAAANIDLNSVGNEFGASVTVASTGAAVLRAEGNLSLAGKAGSLQATSGNIISSGGALEVNSQTKMTAQSVNLDNRLNDFKGTVDLVVSGQVTLIDANDLTTKGRAQELNANVGGTFKAGDLQIERGTLIASAIELNKLNVSDNARLQAETVEQTETVNTDGKLTIQAQTVTLSDTGNDFRGELTLEDVKTAFVRDMNQLVIGGVASTLDAGAVDTLTFSTISTNSLTANAAKIDQTNNSTLTVNGVSNLIARNVDLRNTNNDFAGVVGIDVLERARLGDTNNLTVQGKAGRLDIQADSLKQSAAINVAGEAVLDARSVDLFDSANDFQGEVILAVSGNTNLNDVNSLQISGLVNGPTLLSAKSIQQTNALVANSSLTLESNQINLVNNANAFNGIVRVEGTGQGSQATLHSQGKLQVEGSNVTDLKMLAQEAVLGELGVLQTLGVTADSVTQVAILRVQEDTSLNADSVALNNASNDFAGTVNVQGKNSSRSVVSIHDENSLNLKGSDLELTAQVQGDLELQANNAVFNNSKVTGNTKVDLSGALTQNQSVTLNNSMLKADRIVLNESGNRFNGSLQLDSGKSMEVSTSRDLKVGTGTSTGALALNVGGNAEVSGSTVVFEKSKFEKSLLVNANQVSQTGSLVVRGDAQFNAPGGSVNLQNDGNQLQGFVSANAEQTRLKTIGNMQLQNLISRGGEMTAGGRLLLSGNIVQTGGTLIFTAKGTPVTLSSNAIKDLLPAALDVFSSKNAANPITGLGSIALASAVIEQVSGQILTDSVASTQFNSPKNGSVVLAKVNQMNGKFGALSGQNHGQSFTYNADQGASLFAVNNDVRLSVDGKGVETDVVAIRSRGLSTQGPDALIRVRMPYNDIAAGTSRSYAGLTLSIPLSNANGTQGGAVSFGESSANGQSGSSGAIRVEVGDASRAGLGGFLTVLPFEGSNLLPGQVIYLSGPERRGAQAFFYDGARNLNRVPVVYNGTLLLSPQENAALTTAQGAVVLARQEQTRSVVRTENVAGKVINGVVVEVGPGRPATEGEGGASKPASCDAAESGLGCNP